MADRWTLRFAGGRDRYRACPDGLVARSCHPQAGWADSASDTIVTVRRRAWGQIWRFRRHVPLLHPAPLLAQCWHEMASGSFRRAVSPRPFDWLRRAWMAAGCAGFRRLCPAGTVFKIGERRAAALAGSIPVRLRRPPPPLRVGPASRLAPPSGRDAWPTGPRAAGPGR